MWMVNVRYDGAIMATQRLVLVHGYKGTPTNHWFPWLTEAMEKHGWDVAAPALPAPDKPVCGDWVKTIAEAAGDVDDNTYIVAHSLGCIATLRFLESLPDGHACGGAILVAVFSETTDAGRSERRNSFLEPPLNYEKVKASVKKIVAIHSDNDPFIPLKNGEIMRDKLGAELHVVSNAGHFMKKDGFVEFPLVRERLLAISGPTS